MGKYFIAWYLQAAVSVPGVRALGSPLTQASAAQLLRRTAELDMLGCEDLRPGRAVTGGWQWKRPAVQTHVVDTTCRRNVGVLNIHHFHSRTKLMSEIFTELKYKKMFKRTTM